MSNTTMILRDVVTGMLDLEPEVMQLEGGRRVLLTPRMYGVPQMVTAGEQSDWLLPLKERAVIVGARCPICGQVYAPAYLEWCGNAPCRFAKLELIDLPDVGEITDADPVITLFAPARMNGKAPFAHGLVRLRDGGVDAAVDMMFGLETTSGVMRPGVYKAGTPIKLVFRDDGKREGCITDVFVLPQAELTPEQVRKRPLFESDIDRREPQPPVWKRDATGMAKLEQARGDLGRFFACVNRSPRNLARLKVLDFTMAMATSGGTLVIAARDGAMRLLPDVPAQVSSTLAIEDPGVIGEWTRGKALTNLFALGELWLSNREGVRLLEDLDRLWRAASRDGVL